MFMINIYQKNIQIICPENQINNKVSEKLFLKERVLQVETTRKSRSG